VACLDFEWAQRKIQYYVLFGLLLACITVISASGIEVTAPVIQHTAPAMLAAAAINLSVSAYKNGYIAFNASRSPA
jgi:hypothetical protein